MMIPSYVFKLKAKQALQGNWQTPLLITFFSGVLLTALSVLQATSFPDAATYLSYGQVELLYEKLLAVPRATWIAYYALAIVAFAITPVLTLGANHYFVSRLSGKELGFKGLLSRARYAFKALGLFALMFAKIFLWSLLLIVPGVLAALRYAMAPYYLAENPDMKITDAIEKSKAAMEGNKGTYFMLEISFVGWYFASLLIETLLLSVSTVVALVLSQFMRLFISAYMNASIAALYLTLSREGGISEALQGFRERIRQMGAGDDAISSVDKAIQDARLAEEEREREAQDDGAEGGLEADDADAEDDYANAEEVRDNADGVSDNADGVNGDANADNNDIPVGNIDADDDSNGGD